MVYAGLTQNELQDVFMVMINMSASVTVWLSDVFLVDTMEL